MGSELNIADDLGAIKMKSVLNVEHYGKGENIKQS